jgi:hypothetical protein
VNFLNASLFIIVESKSRWKEFDVASSKEVSQNMPGEADENRENISQDSK